LIHCRRIEAGDVLIVTQLAAVGHRGPHSDRDLVIYSWHACVVVDGDEIGGFSLCGSGDVR